MQAAEHSFIFQDYHVIFMYEPDDRCLVFDLDSDLPFPTYFHKYVTETLRTDHILRPEHYRWVRLSQNTSATLSTLVGIIINVLDIPPSKDSLKCATFKQPFAILP